MSLMWVVGLVKMMFCFLSWLYLVDWILVFDRLIIFVFIDINCLVVIFWIVDILSGFLVVVVVSFFEKEKLIFFLFIGMILVNFVIIKLLFLLLGCL